MTDAHKYVVVPFCGEVVVPVPALEGIEGEDNIDRALQYCGERMVRVDGLDHAELEHLDFYRNIVTGNVWCAESSYEAYEDEF